MRGAIRFHIELMAMNLHVIMIYFWIFLRFYSPPLWIYNVFTVFLQDHTSHPFWIYGVFTGSYWSAFFDLQDFYRFKPVCFIDSQDFYSVSEIFTGSLHGVHLQRVFAIYIHTFYRLCL